MQKRFVLLFSSLVLLFGVYGIFFSDKIQINESKGWDGALYVEYIQRWPDPIVNKELTPFYLKRTFLPAVLHYVCLVQASVQGISMQEFPTSYILHYFDVFNFLFLCLTFLLIYKIAVKLFGEEFIAQPWWIFSWVTMNVCIMKMTFYYPATLDTFTLMLGTVLLYAHLNQKKYWILITMAIGFFTHPLLFITGALLLLWPERIIVNRTISKPVAGMILFLFACLFSYWLHDAYTHAPDFVRPAEERFIILSALCTVAYLVYILYSSRLIEEGINYLFQLRWINLIPISILYVLFSYIVSNTRNEGEGWKTEDFFHQTGYDSMQDPFIFLVAHIVYYGPGILVLLLFADQWKEWLRQQAGGLQLVLWMLFILMVNNESRQLIVFWPFALLLIITVVSKWKQNYLRWSIAIVLLIWSRVWLNMHSDTFKNDDYYNFPAQYYFMHHGPWMSVENYYRQAAVILLMGLFLYFYKKWLNEKTLLPS